MFVGFREVKQLDFFAKAPVEGSIENTTIDLDSWFTQISTVEEEVQVVVAM
mgnify:CR=1 FL=1